MQEKWSHGKEKGFKRDLSLVENNYDFICIFIHAAEVFECMSMKSVGIDPIQTKFQSSIASRPKLEIEFNTVESLDPYPFFSGSERTTFRGDDPFF